MWYVKFYSTWFIPAKTHWKIFMKIYTLMILGMTSTWMNRFSKNTLYAHAFLFISGVLHTCTSTCHFNIKCFMHLSMLSILAFIQLSSKHWNSGSSSRYVIFDMETVNIDVCCHQGPLQYIQWTSLKIYTDVILN